MRKFPIISIVLFIACASVLNVSPDTVGIWDGIIKTPGADLEIAVTFTTGSDGKLTATLDVPEQGQKDVPLSNVDIQGETITFDLEVLPGVPKFEGTFSRDSNEITGTFIQDGEKMPFSLKKVPRKSLQ
jgi:hypothetical protein